MNIGNPHEFTVARLAELVLELTGSQSRIEGRVLPEDAPKVRRPDTTLARTVLGWEPRVQLGEGLEPTIDYFRRRLARDARGAANSAQGVSFSETVTRG